jgi:hypothetical protein
LLIRMRSWAGVSQLDVPHRDKIADLISESRQRLLDIGHVDPAMPKIAADRPQVDKGQGFLDLSAFVGSAWCADPIACRGEPMQLGAPQAVGGERCDGLVVYCVQYGMEAFLHAGSWGLTRG